MTEQPKPEIAAATIATLVAERYTNGRGMLVIDHDRLAKEVAAILRQHFARAVSCETTLAGIEDPAALRKLLDQLPKREHNPSEVLRIMDELFDMIPQPTEPVDG